MNNRRRTRNKQCSSSSDEYEAEEDAMPQKLQKTERTGRKNRNCPLGGDAPARRPVWYWSEFNNWWRTELERLGKRPGKPSIVQWYEANAKRVWPQETPTFQETRLHAKCLRSTEAVRDYFRRYRAARKEQQLEPDGHSNGGAIGNAASSAPSLLKHERHWGARHTAPSTDDSPMDPIALIMQHNQRIAEQQEQQAFAHTQQLILPPQHLVHGSDLPPQGVAHRTLNGNSDGGSVSSAWQGFGSMVAPGAAAEGCTQPWASASLDARCCAPFPQPAPMDCGAGQSDMMRLETCSPFSTLGAAPGPYPRGPVTQIRSEAAPVAGPPLPQSWFAHGGSRAIRESAGGFEPSRLGGHTGAAAVQTATDSRQAWEKRRSDRSSATDEGGPGCSLHACDRFDSEDHDNSESDLDNDDDDYDDRGANEVDEARQWDAKPRLQRTDTPFFRQGFKTAVCDNTCSKGMQQQHLVETSLYDVLQRLYPPPTWQQPQLQTDQSLMRVRQVQAPPPLQLPVCDRSVMKSLPYAPGAPTTVVGSCVGAQPLLVHCGDAHGPTLLQYQPLKQHGLQLQEEQGMCVADPISPTSLLIAAPPLPLLPLRPDDCLLATGPEDGLNSAATWNQPQPRVKEEQLQQQLSQSLWEQADRSESMAALGDDGRFGAMTQIDEGDEIMDEESEDDDESVPEVFWD